MAYITTPGFAGIDLTKKTINKEYPLGIEVQASDGNTWMYTQIDANVRASGEALEILEDGSIGVAIYTPTISAGATRIAFIQHDFSASEYGWVVIKGIDFLSQAVSGCNADVKVYTTGATGNVYDDDSTSNEMLQGLRANETGAATVDISTSSAGYVEYNAQD